MSLKPREVDFDETWNKIQETVSDVLHMRSVARGVWSARFSDVYALCVAQPEPLAERLYSHTRIYLETHVGALLEQVRGEEAEGEDLSDGLIERYVAAWQTYSQGVQYLHCLYSYLNLQHVKRQKASDAEIIYGAAASAGGPELDARQLEIGELGLYIWERGLIQPLSEALSARLVAALDAARDDPERAPRGTREAIHSMMAVRAWSTRAPLAPYERLILEPYLERAAAAHAAAATGLLERGDIAYFCEHTLKGLERETALATRFLCGGAARAVQCYEQSAVRAHLAPLHATAPALLAAAAAAPPHDQARTDARRLYRLVRGLGPDALKPLVAAARELCRADADERLAAPPPHDAPQHFVTTMLAVHDKYMEVLTDVFEGSPVFLGALEQACSDAVNVTRAGAAPPELLARYVDALLRRQQQESDPDALLARAITVFKYIDDKDVFQKHYARALARRLIHHLSASMDLEEAMINRLKAACGYEFTNKLHRMFTDVALSAELNSKFQQHVEGMAGGAGSAGAGAAANFTVQVLQAGAWPLGGGAAPAGGGLPPAPLAAACAQFETYYRAAFSGRRLAWLHHLGAADLKTRFTKRVYHITTTITQCGILLQFEGTDEISGADVRAALQLSADAWRRHARALLDAHLLTHEGTLEQQESLEGALSLNLQFTSRRSRLRLQAAPGQATSGGAPGEAAERVSCEDDRKMYLQAALVRIMKQRKVVRHQELVCEAARLARGQFSPSVALVKKCIETLIDKQYLARTPGAVDCYSYLA